MADDFGLPDGYCIPECASGPTGGPDDPLCVIVKPGDEPIVVTIDPAQFEDLCDKFDAIVTAIEENRPIFDGDALPTPYCTPDGDPVYLCKKTDVQTGEPTYEYQTVPAGASVAVPYTGELELCETPTTKLIEACFDWCLGGVLCVASDDPGTIVSHTYVDAAGTWVSGEGAPDVPFRVGQCMLAGKETKSIWTFPEEGCPEFRRLETVLCYGPKQVVDVDGVLTPLFDTLGEGEIVQPAGTSFGKCVPCPVEPAAEYPADTIAGLQLVSTSCDFVCETGEFADPTTVTVDGVTFDVPAGAFWPPTDSFFADYCGCGDLFGKDITITGPHTVLAAWTNEAKEC